MTLVKTIGMFLYLKSTCENNLIEIINILKHCSLKLLELDKKTVTL